jgi:excisionase family DNA binding protein
LHLATVFEIMVPSTQRYMLSPEVSLKGDQMSSSTQYMTTQEYAEKVGLSASTISKWLRSGKIKGEKQNGKWIISLEQDVQNPIPSPKPQQSVPTNVKTTHKGDAFTVAQFSEMSYLTEFGVLQWLQAGRLKGAKDASGQWQVSADSLNDNNVKRLLRD